MKLALWLLCLLFILVFGTLAALSLSSGAYGATLLHSIAAGAMSYLCLEIARNMGE